MCKIKQLYMIATFVMSITALIISVQPRVANADLVTVDLTNDIYQTTTGGQQIYWYLNLGETHFKSYAEKEQFAADLVIDSSLGVIDNWHIATAAEVAELFGPGAEAVTPTPSAQAALVGEAIKFSGTPSASPVVDQFGAVFNEYSLLEDADHHATGQVYYQTWMGDNWRTWYTGWHADSIDNVRIGAWIAADAAVPTPSAVWLLGSGLISIVGIRRKFSNK